VAYWVYRNLGLGEELWVRKHARLAVASYTHAIKVKIGGKAVEVVR
jgi:hypothetical protein